MSPVDGEHVIGGPGEQRACRRPARSWLRASDAPVSCSGDFKKFEHMSSGTMSSSEELADQEGSVGTSAFEQADLNGTAPELPVAVPSGPFRHTGLSKAARTHRLRKLRSPAKCRECNSYVYFQGAECEEVSGPRDAWGPQAPRVSRSCPAGRVLRAPEPGGAAGAARSPPTPRPTVLPGLPQEVPGDPGHPVRPQEASGPPAALRPGLQPGGPRHPGRRALHPQEVHLRDRAAGAAHQGALGAEAGASPAGCGEEGAAEADCGRLPRPPQGIYRVNGVKTRVEKLCQAFENGKELVELSQASPHDISNVLKLYLRQVSPRAAGLMVGQPGGRGRGRCPQAR